MINFWALILRMDVFLGFFFFFFLAEIPLESSSLREVSDLIPRGRPRGSFQSEPQQTRDLQATLSIFFFFSNGLIVVRTIGQYSGAKICEGEARDAPTVCLF